MIGRRAPTTGPFLFNLLFWTPFWLTLLFVPGETSVIRSSSCVASIVITAGLAGIAELCGKRRRYFYLAAGLVCWLGAVIWLLFLYGSHSPANVFTIVTAGEYMFGDGDTLSFVSVSNWVLAFIACATTPFPILALFWRRLDWPVSPLFAAAGIGAALALVPMNIFHRYWFAAAIADPREKPFYRVDLFPPLDTYYEFSRYLLLRQQLRSYQAQVPLVLHGAHPPLTLIVLVGESTTRRRLGLYGYCRNTTPRLSRRKDLVVFDNLVSPIPLTVFALRRVLLLPSVPTRSGRTDVTLFSLLDSGGFDTYWLSNQYDYGGATDVLTILMGMARHQVWARRIDKKTRLSTQDEILLPLLKHALDAPEPDKAIFLHFMGAHIKYADRYPPGFDRDWPAIAGRTASQSKQIDAYDTAVRFQDQVIDEAITMAEAKSNQNIALVYFSDHGEEVHDQYPMTLHSYPNATRAMVEAPLLLWLSPALRRSRPDLVQALERARHEPLEVNDIGPLLMDVAGIHTVGDTVPHPLTPNFSEGPRMVGGHDYNTDPNIGRMPQLSPLCPSAR